MIIDEKTLIEAVERATHDKLDELDVVDIVKNEIRKQLDMKFEKQLAVLAREAAETIAKTALDAEFVPVSSYGVPSPPTTMRMEFEKAAQSAVKAYVGSVNGNYSKGSIIVALMEQQVKEKVAAWFDAQAESLKSELIVLAAERLQTKLSGAKAK